MNRFYVIICYVLFVFNHACTSKLPTQEEALLGMWIATYGHYPPTIFEFKQNHSVVIMYHPQETKTRKWRLQDSLVIIEQDDIPKFAFDKSKAGLDTLFFWDDYNNRRKVTRIQRFDQALTQPEITKLLTKKSWTYGSEEANLLEFYSDDAGYDPYKDGLQRRHDQEGFFTNYIYWWIENINGQLFLNTYHLIDANLWGSTEQIISVEPHALKTYNYLEDTIKDYVAKPTVNADSVKNLLIGTWVSDNANAVRDTTDFFPSNEELFRGKIYITFERNGKYKFWIDGHEPYDEKWSLSDDGRTVIISIQTVDQNNEPDSSIYNLHYIEALGQKKLALKLDNSQIMTRKDFIYVNTHQQFNKIE